MVRVVVSENDAIIEEAVEAFHEGLLQAALDDPELQKTLPLRDPQWKPVGARFIFPEPEHELVVRPMGEDGAEVEVIEGGTPPVIVACQSERGYTSADDLRARIERIYAATRSPR